MNALTLPSPSQTTGTFLMGRLARDTENRPRLSAVVLDQFGQREVLGRKDRSGGLHVKTTTSTTTHDVRDLSGMCRKWRNDYSKSTEPQ